ncbi:hypothetical protein OIU78_026712 [Salix suchowensis]|nr:hypothetical protein OIU78_026712 [Salix suchowensis]
MRKYMKFVQCAQRAWYNKIYMPQKSAANMMLSNREKYATPESYCWVTTGDEHATSQKSLKESWNISYKPSE